MSTWVNLHNHSRYSWDSASPVNEIVDFVVEHGMTAHALTEHGNMNSAIELYLECRKKNIKPIIGTEFYICQNGQSADDKNADNRKLDHLVVLAKNKIGYQNLMRLNSIANSASNFYYKPRIDKNLIERYKEGLIVITGHIGSVLSNIFFNTSGVYDCDTLDEVRAYLYPTYRQTFEEEASWYAKTFGDDFYVEVQLFDPEDIFQQSHGKLMLELAKEYGYQAVGTGDSHYIRPSDQPYHKTFVCIKQNKKYDKEPYSRYMDSGMYGIITPDHAAKCYPQELIDATIAIADKIELYDIVEKPRLPSYPVDDKEGVIYNYCMSQLGVKCPDNDIYRARIDEEMTILRNGDMFGYFLIVQDYIKFAEDNGIMVGSGRGSAAGSLISYLLGITKIDPIPYKLLFSRFYSADRAEAGQMPDIDTDFQSDRRAEVVAYIQEKYGVEQVAGLLTFNLLQGRSALKDVLRVHNAADFSTSNKITEGIPGKDKVSDKMADFYQEHKSRSLLLYCLIEEPDTLKDYCRYDVSTKEYSGPYAEYFKIAVGLEGAIKSESKHPCAMIISDRPIIESSPLVKDSDGEMVVGYSNLHESVSLAKFDILGISSLTRLHEVNMLIKEIGMIE